MFIKILWFICTKITDVQLNVFSEAFKIYLKSLKDIKTLLWQFPLIKSFYSKDLNTAWNKNWREISIVLPTENQLTEIESLNNEY